MALRSRAACIGGLIVAIAACSGTSSTVDEPGASSSGGSATGADSDSGTGSGTGSGSGSGEQDGGGHGTPADAGRDARPNDEACPKTFSAPPGSCKLGTTCEYEEGTCKCVARCGGALPEDEAVGQWRCTQRPDPSCPAQAPVSGSPCKGTVHCRYGECCPLLYECINGKWAAGGTICPPGLDR